MTDRFVKESLQVQSLIAQLDKKYAEVAKLTAENERLRELLNTYDMAIGEEALAKDK